MMDRRRFLALGGLSAAALVAQACDSMGPKGAKEILRCAEHQNEGVERFLFRHTSMDRAASERLAGRRMPSYFVSPEPPV